MNFNPEEFDPAHDYRAQFNGVEVPVEIEADETGVSPLQLEALRLALEPAPEMLELSAPAVVQNYEVYREMLGDDELPPLENPLDVWKSVEPTRIEIPPHEDVETPSFLLMAECDWDPEHGLVVRFRDGIANAASQQGELWI